MRLIIIKMIEITPKYQQPAEREREERERERERESYHVTTDKTKWKYIKTRGKHSKKCYYFPTTPLPYFRLSRDKEQSS